MRAAPKLDIVAEAARPRDRFRWLGDLQLLRQEWPEQDEGARGEVHVAVGVCERCGVLLHWNSRRYHTGCKGRTWRA